MMCSPIYVGGAFAAGSGAFSGPRTPSTTSQRQANSPREPSRRIPLSRNRQILLLRRQRVAQGASTIGSAGGATVLGGSS